MGKMAFEPLWTYTAELLKRVQTYDRKAAFREELARLKETHRILGTMRTLPGGEFILDRSAMKLKRMRDRLLTMMEDLLYTA